MGSSKTSSLLLSTILLIFFPLICYSQQGNQCNNVNTKLIKGLFVFGSSVVDNGNNVFLDTFAPNFLPYGVDFPLGPTGRYSNGKTVIDIFGEYLCIPNFIPPFYNPSTNGAKIINGVDFASGGSGILDATGNNIDSKVASLSTQINNFVKTTLPELEVQLGMKSENFLGNYMFVFGVGGNDITSNYFGNPITQTVEVFAANLIQLLSGHIQNLYSVGGRKFVLLSVYPLGCYPINRDIGQNKCNETLNDAATIYNSQLKSMVDDLHSKMPGSNLIFVDVYNIMQNLILNPTSQGFENVTSACIFEVQKSPTTNKPISWKICPNRKTFIFFDNIHATEAVNYIIASKAFYSNLQSEVYPINITNLSIM